MTISLSNDQYNAVKAILAWYKGGANTPQEFYLAGYAGVGKSTIAQFIIDELKAHANVRTVCTGTFTGKAANVLRRKGVTHVSTIHAMIYIPVEDLETGELKFMLDASAPASKADLIILDEVSMVNEELAVDLRRFGKKMLVMGDPGQLPPVTGYGSFTNRTPDIFLHEIHRQAEDSPILLLATLARQGIPLPQGKWIDADGNITTVLPNTIDNQKLLYRHETQVICGLHKVRWSITHNIRKSFGFEGAIPLPGESVICCRNNKELGLFNGGFGKILNPVVVKNYSKWQMNIAMEDLQKPLKKLNVNPWLFQQHTDNTIVKPFRIHKNTQEFDWGWALTCHKAQGSSWPDVTIVDDSSAFRESKNLWLYTAITRAEKSMTLLSRDF